jgi:processive 1,2-diacylglycerol beta-glucosyltransferase
MAAARGRESLPKLKVVGFTADMDEWMAAAGLVTGKSGGLTAWESFQRGVAGIVVNPIPGREERNTVHLLEQKAGIWCHHFHTVACKVDALLGGRRRLQAMAVRSRRRARPDARPVIAEKCLGLM